MLLTLLTCNIQRRNEGRESLTARRPMKGMSPRDSWGLAWLASLGGRQVVHSLCHAKILELDFRLKLLQIASEIQL